ncbi:MAG: hypothetical protein HXS44_12945 [Theionarchaea archaeon]|nr:hypothetical protein [Theionarchaea archaeon]
MNYKAAALLLIAGILIFPFSAASIFQEKDESLYTFKAHIVGPLKSSYTVYEYSLAEAIEGVYPEKEIILVTSMILTEGDIQSMQQQNEVWIKGRLLTEDYVCGTHEMYPDVTHVYVIQVKGVLWPEQIYMFKTLLKSPVTGLVAPSYIWFYLVVENPSIHTFEQFSVLVMKTVLVYAAIFSVIRYRTEKWIVMCIILAYALMTMMISIPELFY